MSQDALTQELRKVGLTGFHGLLPADQEALMTLSALVSAETAVQIWQEHIQAKTGLEHLSWREQNRLDEALDGVAELDPPVADSHWCPDCGGEGEYEADCQECGGDEYGCEFCDYTGKVWLPCYNCPAEKASLPAEFDEETGTGYLGAHCYWH